MLKLNQRKAMKYKGKVMTEMSVLKVRISLEDKSNVLPLQEQYFVILIDCYLMKQLQL